MSSGVHSWLSSSKVDVAKFIAEFIKKKTTFTTGSNQTWHKTFSGIHLLTFDYKEQTRIQGVAYIGIIASN